jgi:hypothetical protein
MKIEIDALNSIEQIKHKRNYADIAKRDIANFAGRQYASMSQQEIRQYVNKMIILDMQNPFLTEKTKEKWIKNPMPSIAEPSKMIHAFTPIERYDLEHQANLYRKGSLHAIDRFFMQIRRKVRMFERPIKSGTNKMRVWNGYSPYNPENYQKLADIFRVFYNYCQPYEKTKDTPAMRLGLAKGVVDIEKVIYFKKY